MTNDSKPAWWRNAVFYEIYVRSFADGNGDGLGDLPGIRSRLSYLRELGVDAIWLTPFYPSPDADHGYDVSNYVDVDPRFGTLDDFRALVADAHARSLRVVIDLVPNHTSREHAWFQNALSSTDHPDRGRYVFRPGRGDRPPNNWPSVFGGPAWTRDPASGEWYLHRFAWRESAPGTFLFERVTDDEVLLCAVNIDGAPMTLPRGDIVLASDATAVDPLPARTAAWIRER